MTLERFQSRISALTWRINAESEVLPGQHHTRTGIPVRVTAIPTTTCGRSSRWSLDLPWVRNPTSLSASFCTPSATTRPWVSRATGSSAVSVSK